MMDESRTRDYKESGTSIKDFFHGLAERILNAGARIGGEGPEGGFDGEDEIIDTRGREEAPAPRYERTAAAAKKPVNNVINFNREKMSNKIVEITDPANLEDARRVVDYLLQGVIVTVNLESIDKKDAQRVADFVCGASYAVDASIGRISNHIFIITPNGTDVSGGKKETDGGDYSLPRVASHR